MDRRLIACAVAALSGLALGGLFWALDGDSAQKRAFSDIDQRLDAISSRVRRGPDRPSDALARALAAPLLGGAEKVAEVAEVPVQLVGLVRRPGRNAALLAIAGAPAQWLSLGQEARGVSLESVSDAGVVVMTPAGQREIGLNAGNGATPAKGSEEPPPGVRSPPPPASAPGVR